VTAIGIDLGTTNSVVATYDPGRARPRVVTVGGARSTPSAVSMRHQDGKEELLVGRNALNWANRDPENAILSVKRLMGRDFADPVVEQARLRRSYQIVPGPDEDPRAHVVILGKVHAPAEVSTFILEHLRNGAAQTLNTPVTHAVITVPAYFEEAQRKATREAGERAGLVVKRIIDEPTAAAIAFGLESGNLDRRRVLVYDLGGGTFDISVLNATEDKQGQPHFQAIEFNGDNWLGGDDFDALIVDRIIDWVKTNAGADPSGNAEFMFRAKEAAEKAKLFLSDNDSADIVIPYAYKTAEGFIDVTMTLSREDFDALIEPLVERTINLVRTVLDRQNLTTSAISDVLLVGGATLTPKVYETVEAFFGKGKVRRDVDPMECVAIGAGILANTLHGVQCQSCGAVNDESADNCTECEHSLVNARSAGDTHIHDVTGMALGVNAVKGSHRDAFVPIIPRGTPYPMSEPMRHSFAATDGKRIRVPVYEGDSTRASENREQGVIEYELPEEIDVHSRVDVAFMFDRNRVLHVTITVPGTDFESHETLRFDGPRTPLGTTTSSAENEDTAYRSDLTFAQEMTAVFLSKYERYLDPPQAMKVHADLDRAKQAMMFSEPVECRRMLAILESDLFNSGLASALLLADHAAERATGDEARQLNQTVASVKDAFHDGKRSVVQEQARVLRVLVANILNRQEVAEIHDAEDYAGLLKLLES
jgi:molecular chaperone DnaK